MREVDVSPNQEGHAREGDAREGDTRTTAAETSLENGDDDGARSRLLPSLPLLRLRFVFLVPVCILVSRPVDKVLMLGCGTEFGGLGNGWIGERDYAFLSLSCSVLLCLVCFYVLVLLGLELSGPGLVWSCRV